MTQGRVCVICGRRLYKNKWVAWEFPVILKEMGINGIWAHASCLARAQRYLENKRKLEGYIDND